MYCGRFGKVIKQSYILIVFFIWRSITARVDVFSVLRTDGVMMVTPANLILEWSERHQVVSMSGCWRGCLERGLVRSSVCLHEVSDVAPHALQPHCSASLQPQKPHPTTVSLDCDL